MNEEIARHYVFIRFREPDKFRDGYISRLAEFTNYEALIAANNPTNAINVDIRSYCFDHARVREELYGFINCGLVASHCYPRILFQLPTMMLLEEWPKSPSMRLLMC